MAARAMLSWDVDVALKLTSQAHRSSDDQLFHRSPQAQKNRADNLSSLAHLDCNSSATS
jgi:hypothetical protein